MHIAAKNGYVEIAKYIVTQRMDIDAKDLAGRTPLYLALKNN